MTESHWDRYWGKREALGVALIMHDPYDQFGWCQEWRFAIADVLVFDRGEGVPGFYPAPSGPEEESLAYHDLMADRPSTEALWYALNILDRFREQLRLAGADY